MTSKYERELKAFLQQIKKPFIVIRAAGSFGIDLVAVRDDISFPIEVKSSFEHIFHFSDSPRLMEQANYLKTVCTKAKIFPLYAFRLKNVRGDAWRLFTLELKGLKGKAKQIYDKIPKLRKTASNNYLMCWEEGLPLHEFISWVSRG